MTRTSSLHCRHRQWQISWGLLGAFVLSAWIAQTTSGSAQTLQQALASAYLDNPQLEAERANLRATDENVPQALANWRPTVQFTGQGGIAHNKIVENRPANGIIENGAVSSDTGFGTTNLGSQSLGISVSQPLYRGGRTSAQTEQAEDQVRAERARLASTEQNLFLQVVTDYLNLYRDQRILDLAEVEERAMRGHLDQVQQRFRLGDLTLTDLSQAKAALASAIVTFESEEGQAGNDAAALRRDAVLSPGKLQAVLPLPLAGTHEEAIATARAANPNVIAADYDQKAAEADIRVVRGQLLPQVSLVASANRTHNAEYEHSRNTEEQVVAQVTVPLYEGGSVYSQTRQAKQTVAQRRHQLDDARAAAAQSAEAAWSQRQAALATLDADHTQIEADRVALEGTQRENSVGARTVLDILNAEEVLFQSHVALVQAEHDLRLAEYTLVEAEGRLTAADLDLPVQLYDPDANYRAVRNKWVGFGD